MTSNLELNPASKRRLEGFSINSLIERILIPLYGSPKHT